MIKPNKLINSLNKNIFISFDSGIKSWKCRNELNKSQLCLTEQLKQNLFKKTE